MAKITKEQKQQRIYNLCINLLETIADATIGMEVGDYDCGKLYSPILRYQPSFEFTKEEVETIKQIAKDDTLAECAETLTEWFKDAKKERQ